MTNREMLAIEIAAELHYQIAVSGMWFRQLGYTMDYVPNDVRDALIAARLELQELKNGQTEEKSIQEQAPTQQ